MINCESIKRRFNNAKYDVSLQLLRSKHSSELREIRTGYPISGAAYAVIPEYIRHLTAVSRLCQQHRKPLPEAERKIAETYSDFPTFQQFLKPVDTDDVDTDLLNTIPM